MPLADSMKLNETEVLAPLIPYSSTGQRLTSSMSQQKQTTSNLSFASSPETGSEANVSREGSRVLGYTDLINRTVFTFVMIYVFLSLISLGVVAGIPILIVVLVIVFHEITSIQQKVRKERQLPSLHVLKWYLLSTSVAFVTLHNIRIPLVAAMPAVQPLYNELPFIAFCAIMFGLVAFVLSLQKGMYRYQFIQFTWTAMALLFIVAQGAAEMRNMMRGMIWFLLPVSCVINNDIWAFVFGKLFGRTKLLALSPKKTLEGFLGAFFLTVIWAFWFSGFLSYFPELCCPVVDFRISHSAKCEKDVLFIQKEVELPLWMRQLTKNYVSTILVAPIQKHAIILGTFASLVAPFGGFFASGLKRAFRLKDFGKLIPGHGGMTDRMDCQGVMGMFTYFYIRTYISRKRQGCLFADILHCALALSGAEKQSLMQQLAHSLEE